MKLLQPHEAELDSPGDRHVMTLPDVISHTCRRCVCRLWGTFQSVSDGCGVSLSEGFWTSSSSSFSPLSSPPPSPPSPPDGLEPTLRRSSHQIPSSSGRSTLETLRDVGLKFLLLRWFRAQSGGDSHRPLTGQLDGLCASDFAKSVSGRTGGPSRRFSSGDPDASGSTAGTPEEQREDPRGRRTYTSPLPAGTEVRSRLTHFLPFGDSLFANSREETEVSSKLKQNISENQSGHLL